MRHFLFCALVALPGLAHAGGNEIEMPADAVRPEPPRATPRKPAVRPKVAADNDDRKAKPASDDDVAPARAPKPKLAPAKEVATDDDETSARKPKSKLAPAKEVDDAPVRKAKPAAAPAREVASDDDGDAKAGTDDDAPPGLPEAAPAAPTGPAQEPSVADTVASPAHPHKWVEPYGAIAGGVRLESLHQEPTQHTGTQNPTVAVSRLGLRGGVGEHITFASEFEAALGGPLGYGASVWEGQAAIAIRNQFVRYARDGFAFAAGRIDDPASFDYVSMHVADLLLTDLYTRDPLLYSGADRGNGIWGSYAFNKHVTAGMTFHSTNPTGITGTLIIGGKLQPFDRPFYLAAAQVGNNQNNLPDQNLHIYFGSPSLTVHYDNIEIKSEVQMYSLDTQEAINTDQTIRGYNLRLGARAWTDTTAGRFTTFANVSRNTNEILDSTTSMYRLPDLFKSYTLSAGFDLDYWKHNGFGFQYAMVDTREPDQHTRQHYLNLGTTYWIEDSLAIGVRAAVYAQQISGEMMTTGSRSLFVTARLVLN